jgi:hypothetical protein
MSRKKCISRSVIFGPFEILWRCIGYVPDTRGQPQKSGCRVPSMTTDYLDYLDSPEWWQQRRAALLRAGYRCEREYPNGPRHEGPLEVHHRKYHRLGDEAIDDLEVLCAVCHEAEGKPCNRMKLRLELCGQQRLFDRWEDPVLDVLRDLVEGVHAILAEGTAA